MSIGQSMVRARRAATAALLAASAAGCGGGGGGTTPPPQPPAADTEAPAITNVLVAPSTLRFTGGRVTVVAEVTDPAGVSRVWTEVAKPDASTETLELAQAGGQGYSASWTAPGNPEVGGTAHSYGIRIFAQDAKGNVAVIGPLMVKVDAVEAPPPMPLP